MKNFLAPPPNFIKAMLLCLFMLLSPIPSYADGRTISFTWTPNTDTTTIGYKLYYKTGSIEGEPYDGTDLDQGISPITIPGKTVSTYEVTGASANVTYHFALKAYNADNEQSTYSSNVPVPPSPFQGPTIKIITQK